MELHVRYARGQRWQQQQPNWWIAELGVRRAHSASYFSFLFFLYLFFVLSLSLSHTHATRIQLVPLACCILLCKNNIIIIM